MENFEPILQCLAKEYPEAGTALNFSNSFELLIATVLAAQCTDKQVNKVTERLFARYKIPEDFARLTVEQIEQEIRGCGLYRNKAKNIKALSQRLLQDFEGKVPQTMEELISLPGVGRKTANVVLANAFNRSAFAVDTHVFRLAHRFGWSKAKNPEGVEHDLCTRIPRDLWSQAHHWMIHHGRQVCKARNPRCGECGFADHCPRVGVKDLPAND